MSDTGRFTSCPASLIEPTCGCGDPLKSEGKVDRSLESGDQEADGKGCLTQDTLLGTFFLVVMTQDHLELLTSPSIFCFFSDMFYR